ncbi:MAG: hypothetical protein C5B55_02510 [Blastocatellia bacterium]|nr:MAG: hypothetical protein C5B55_02510 [Blastocatellia bacterium]
MVEATGKLSSKDTAMARLLKFAPWLALILTTFPVPVVFLVLFLLSEATESAAIYLLLAGLSLAAGAALGLLISLILVIYRRHWLAQLRDRLASDGITANEVVWFRSELTSSERAALDEIKQTNPLLADAYLDTLASRLTASRIISRSKREILKVERRINRARTLGTNEANALQQELEGDRTRLDQIRQNANEHLMKARTQLQVIEATASRKLNETETNLMMQRLGSAEDTLPLVLEIARMEQQVLRESRDDHKLQSSTD